MNLDKELINYLMTSDFSEDLSNDKLREYLKSFRYMYRYQHGKLNSLSMEIGNLNSKITNLVHKIELLERNLNEVRLELDYHKDRKLSFWERIKGKIKK